jgi:hypothetical protein
MRPSGSAYSYFVQYNPLWLRFFAAAINGRGFPVGFSSSSINQRLRFAFNFRIDGSALPHGSAMAGMGG